MTKQCFFVTTKGIQNRQIKKSDLADLNNEKVAQLALRNDVDYYEDIKDINVFKPFLKHMNT